MFDPMDPQRLGELVRIARAGASAGAWPKVRIRTDEHHVDVEFGGPYVGIYVLENAGDPGTRCTDLATIAQAREIETAGAERIGPELGVVESTSGHRRR